MWNEAGRTCLVAKHSDIMNSGQSTTTRNTFPNTNRAILGYLTRPSQEFWLTIPAHQPVCQEVTLGTNKFLYSGGRHMRVLVTGGAGFIGSHLCSRLVGEGFRVLVIDDLSTGFRHNLPPDVPLVQRDVCDSLDDVFHDFRPDTVFHLAAQVSVPRSLQSPARDLAVNVSGTVNVVEAAGRADTRKVVMVSSSAVYGEPQDLPLTEKSVTAPVSPYGLSKLTGEHYVRMLCPLYRMSYTIIRPANVFGPRQHSEGEGAVIPSFIRCFTEGVDPVIHGDGLQTRDFLYVGDMVSAFLCANSSGDGQILHASSSKSISILSVWKKLAQLLGWTRPPNFGPPRPGDIQRSVMSNDAARVHLGWEPRFSVADGLAHTVAWMNASRAAASDIDL